MDAVQNSKPHAFAATQEHLKTLTDQLEPFRITVETDPLSDEILSNYASFLPYRDEAITLVRAIARAEPDARYGDALHAFLERFLEHFHPSPERGTHRKFDFDNYKFFARHGVHKPGHPEMGRRERCAVALHRPWETAAERPHRIVQR